MLFITILGNIHNGEKLCLQARVYSSSGLESIFRCFVPGPPGSGTSLLVDPALYLLQTIFLAPEELSLTLLSLPTTKRKCLLIALLYVSHSARHFVLFL